jgi:hypothetical protein
LTLVTTNFISHAIAGALRVFAICFVLTIRSIQTKRREVTEGWRKLYENGLHNLEVRDSPVDIKIGYGLDG